MVCPGITDACMIMRLVKKDAIKKSVQSYSMSALARANASVLRNMQATPEATSPAPAGICTDGVCALEEPAVDVEHGTSAHTPGSMLSCALEDENGPRYPLDPGSSARSLIVLPCGRSVSQVSGGPAPSAQQSPLGIRDADAILAL